MEQQMDSGAETLAERAYRKVRDRLVMLDIAPGSPLRDEQIGAELGVGRTPVREALKRLEGEQLVVSYPRRGTFAAEVNLQDLRRLSEVREQLEPLAARLAAERASTAQRRELRTCLDDALAPVLARPGSGRREQIRADLALHRSLYSMVHNPYLEYTLHYYGNLNTRIWCLALAGLPDMAAHVAEHRAVVDAICAGDGACAAEIMREHVSHFTAVVREVL